MNETGYERRIAQEQRIAPVLSGSCERSAKPAGNGWPQSGPGDGLAGSGTDERKD
jgi:hypothetical protein